MNCCDLTKMRPKEKSHHSLDIQHSAHARATPSCTVKSIWQRHPSPCYVAKDSLSAWTNLGDRMLYSRRQSVRLAYLWNFDKISNLTRFFSFIASHWSEWSQSNFVHPNIRLLSWYVQNFIVIRWSMCKISYQSIRSISFKLKVPKLQWLGKDERVPKVKSHHGSYIPQWSIHLFISLQNGLGGVSKTHMSS